MWIRTHVIVYNQEIFEKQEAMGVDNPEEYEMLSPFELDLSTVTAFHESHVDFRKTFYQGTKIYHGVHGTWIPVKIKDFNKIFNQYKKRNVNDLRSLTVIQ